ncbi:MAG: hypothetical protein AAF844_04645 [Pseudomonadota bacterium]
MSDAEVSTTTRILAEAGQRPFLPLALDALASTYRHRSEIRQGVMMVHHTRSASTERSLRSAI